MATYKKISISAEGSGVPVAGGELGEFELGYDEFGGSIHYGTGVTFARIDRETETYRVLTAYPNEYRLLATEG